jgi:hypothetical protein
MGLTSTTLGDAEAQVKVERLMHQMVIAMHLHHSSTGSPSPRKQIVKPT